MEQIWNENDQRLSQFVLKCDILLLADVFEKFRNSSLKNYGLCPSHHLSTLALSWDAILNMTKVEVELTSDPDIYINSLKKVREVEFPTFLIEAVKPTISIWNLKSYDPKQETKHIIHLDANNLYG